MIVIASYLFASPTLDVEAMFTDLDHLLHQLGHGAVTLLYTNSTRGRTPTDSIQRFGKGLWRPTFECTRKGQGEIVVERTNRWQSRRLYYALFHRPRRQSLPLGG